MVQCHCNPLYTSTLKYRTISFTIALTVIPLSCVADIPPC